MSPYDRWLITISLLLSAIGCASHPLDGFEPWDPPPTLFSEDDPPSPLPIRPPHPDAEDPVPRPPLPPELSLAEVLRAVLLGSPELAGYAWEVRAAEARALQTSVYPNPRVGVEVENFLGSGDLSGFDGAETTVSLSQVFPLGGKIEHRTDLAALDRDLAGWDYEAHRTRVLVEATRRFVDVLAGQRQIKLTQESQQLATLVHELVTKRVDAGDTAPTETSRTAVSLALARIEVRRAQSALRIARYRLAETWGDTTDRFGPVVGTLDIESIIPTLETLEQRVNESPELARWIAEIARGQVAVELAKAEGVPDLEVEGGFRYMNASEDVGLVLGLSVPIPFYDSNQGGVLEARYNLAKAAAQRNAVQVQVHASLMTAYQELTSAHTEATALRDEVLPVARTSFEMVQSAFNQGDGRYLDMLDAQRTLTEVRGQYVDALAKYHRAAATVEGLIARPLSSLSEISDSPVPELEIELEIIGDTP